MWWSPKLDAILSRSLYRTPPSLPETNNEQSSSSSQMEVDTGDLESEEQPRLAPQISTSASDSSFSTGNTSLGVYFFSGFSTSSLDYFSLST